MPGTLTYSGQLVIVKCWCGITHAVPHELYDYQQRQHRDGERQRAIYCPLGHDWYMAGEGEAARLRRQLDAARDRAGRFASQRDQAEASARAYKGVATKARKRAKAGTCPCCNRTFKQLARHMASQHPDFEPEAVES
jgi:hypothetical protein